MKNHLLRLSAAFACLACFAPGADAGMIDLTLKAGSSLAGFGSGSVSVPLTSSITSGVSGVPNGTSSLTGVDLVLNNSGGLSITNLPGAGTIAGTYGAVSQVADGTGGTIYSAAVQVSPPAGYSDYAHGTLTIDVANPTSNNPTVIKGDVVFNSVPEPSSVAMTALGFAAALAGYRARRKPLA